MKSQSLANLYLGTIFSQSMLFMSMLLHLNYQINTIQYKQTAEQLDNIRLKLLSNNNSSIVQRSISFNLRKYYHFHCKSLLTTININKIFGNFLLMTLLINTPLNAYLVMTLVNQRLSFWFFINTLCGITFQIMFIFVLHLASINYSKHVHSTSKTLLSINILIKLQYINIYDRLKLWHYISKTHTKQKYGTTYGKIGIVTFSTFFKVKQLKQKFFLIKE